MMPHASAIFTVPYISIKPFRGNNLHLNATSGQVCFTQTSAIEMNDKMLSLAKFTCSQVFSIGIITYLCPTVIFISSSLCGFRNQSLR
jgi:hypothetical protein